jgi:hypothetical protein
VATPGWVGAAASTLASDKHADLVLAGRDLERLSAAAQQLRDRYGIRVTPLLLDLASLDSVPAAAAEVRSMIAAGTVAPFQALLGHSSVDLFLIVPTGMRRRLRSITSATFS